MVEKKGSLRKYIMNKYGNKGFTERGTLRLDILKEELNKAKKEHNVKLERKIVQALNFRKGKR